ncbi:MAG: hypothetical protein H0Z38_02680 [Firmicutes bacterium]|nr:hypothetical protein [Bacillota bacterium]
MARLSEKVIEHLRFARNWLERAEEEYSKEQILEGELTLSLAQAEVRHAWETSRGSELSTTLRAAQLWRRRIMLVAVVSLVAWGGFHYYHRQGPGYPGTEYQLGQPVMPGRWEKQIEYKLVIQPPVEIEQVSSKQTAEPEKVQIEPETQNSVSPEAAGEREVPQVQEQPAPLPVKEEALKGQEPAVKEAETLEPVEPEPESVKPAEPEKPEQTAAQGTDAPEEQVEPPQIDLGELFKVANNALNSE